MEDSKHYTALTNGCWAVSKTEWDNDSQKLATGKPDGATLYIYTEGGYDTGCDYAFAQNGHWYKF